MKTIDDALAFADNVRTTVDAEGFACAEYFALVCLAAEVRRLREELAEWKAAAGVAALTVGLLKEENERLCCQLAGCGVAALENTVSSRSRRAVRGDYGHSASYEDVCNAVDREIALREENERLRGWIRVEGGCNNTCTRQILGEVCHGCKCGKTLPEPAP